jgi:DNA polymerase III alpha subunit
LTIQYLTGKTALKDTVKSYLEYGEQDSLEITNNIESLFGKVDSLNKTLEKSKAIQDWVKESDKNQEAFAIAKKIEGLIRGVGQHASGVFLFFYPVEDIVPTEFLQKKMR